MTPSELIHCGVRSDRANAFAGAITAALAEFAIFTPQQQAAFMAQVLHESGALRYVKEIWGPTPEQATYERDFSARWGDGLKRGERNYKPWRLGNVQAGDGFRYRGRGLIQTTGRDNYTRTGKALGLDLIRYPESLESPLLAARSAGYFWHAHQLNALADAGDIEAISRTVNGGINGLAARQALYFTCLEVLS